MALVTIGCGVGTNQWETALLVNSGSIGDNPGRRCMAACTFLAVGAFVEVGMALHTLVARFLENQAFMTLAALYGCMPAFQRKTSGIVLKPHSFFQDFPGFRGMTLAAIDGKSLSMRG